MTRTAIIAAMPGELKPLVHGWPHSTRNGVQFWAQRTEEEEWIVACAGAGQAAATRAFAAIEDGGPIDLVLSVGWAGALTSQVETGKAYNVAGVIDAMTGERFRCDAGAGEFWLATSPKVADEAEKRRLSLNIPRRPGRHGGCGHRPSGGDARGHPFYCFKGVSDALDAKLPDFNRFIAPNGQFMTARFTLFALIRPWNWPALVQDGRK